MIMESIFNVFLVVCVFVEYYSIFVGDIGIL